MKFKTLSSVALLATMTAGALVGPAAFAETESKHLLVKVQSSIKKMTQQMK
ncbi:hypothetical protein GQR36_20095 [Enterococcus termitis]